MASGKQVTGAHTWDVETGVRKSERGENANMAGDTTGTVGGYEGSTGTILYDDGRSVHTDIDRCMVTR